MSFTAAIIGRPNVGKSTLFNRLAGKKLALVDDTPGVTRDRRVHPARLYDLDFDVIDTAGFEDAGPETLQGRMRAQTEIAIREADLVFFVIDAKTGLLPDDKTFADIVRRSGKPVVLVANKAEARGAGAGMLEAWELGLGEPVPISAEHGQGMPDLRDAIIAALGEERVFADEHEEAGRRPHRTCWSARMSIRSPTRSRPTTRPKPMRIAVVGRPNAGKSTLINALIGEERLLTGPEAGITRDSISVDWDWHGRTHQAVRHGRHAPQGQGAGEARKAVRGRWPARHPLCRSGDHRARRDDPVREAGPADRRPHRPRRPRAGHRLQQMGPDRETGSSVLAELREKTERLLPQVRGIQAVPVSAETGRGLDKLMDAVIRTHQVWNRRISTGKLNRWLEGILAHHPPPAVAGRRLKIKYSRRRRRGRRASSCPARGRNPCRNPTFAIWRTACARPSTCRACRSASCCVARKTRSPARRRSRK